jgi:hypothetical protein
VQQIPETNDAAAKAARSARPNGALDPHSVPQRVEILDARSAGRREAEAFIREDYARAYGADLNHFLPQLMSLRCRDGALRAVLGFRPARGELLYLEHYLNQPVERVLAEGIAGTVTRDRLVEVGNLAVAHAGGARWLIAALTAYLYTARIDWAVFTAVTALRNAFARLGVELVTLAAADAGRLPPEERSRWGRYYDTAPMVVAANVRQSYSALLHSLGLAEDRYRLRPMWDSAHSVGAAAAA